MAQRDRERDRERDRQRERQTETETEAETKETHARKLKLKLKLKRKHSDSFQRTRVQKRPHGLQCSAGDIRLQRAPVHGSRWLTRKQLARQCLQATRQPIAPTVSGNTAFSCTHINTHQHILTATHVHTRTRAQKAQAPDLEDGEHVLECKLVRLSELLHNTNAKRRCGNECRVLTERKETQHNSVRPSVFLLCRCFRSGLARRRLRGSLLPAAGCLRQRGQHKLKNNGMLQSRRRTTNAK